MEDNEIHSKGFNISELAINKPVATIMMMFTLIVLGLFSYSKLNVELYPDVSFPVVSISTEYAGASSKEIESLITKPIEDSVSGIAGLHHIRSTSGNGFSSVIVEFKIGKNPQDAANDVKEKVALIRTDLPFEIKEPIIARFDPNSSAIISFIVSGGQNIKELTDLVKDKIKPELQKAEGVANITIQGATEREIQILINPLTLKKYKISFDTISNKLKEENLNFPSGKIDTKNSSISIRTMSGLKNSDQVGKIKVKLHDGKTLYLKDIAEIKDGIKDIKNKSFFNNKPALVLDIIKQSGANTVNTVASVQKKVKNLDLPQGVKLDYFFDTAQNILDAKDSALEELIVGSILAIIVIFIFLRTIGGTIIAALAIPTSVISTYGMMYFMGFSINTMTLLALALVVGVLVDDAVVDLENIYRRMELGESPRVAAIKATDEIGLAVLATTFSIVAVFVPVAFMTGIIGQYFKQFGLTVSFSVLISLLVARTLTPALSAKFLTKPKVHHDENTESSLQIFYKSILTWSLKHRFITSLIALIIFLLSLPIAGLLPQGFIPKTDSDEVWVSIKMPTGLNIKKTEQIVKKASDIVAKNKYVKNSLTVIGGIEGGSISGRINVTLQPKSKRNGITGFKIQDQLKESLKKIANATINVKAADANDDPNNSYAMSLSFKGDDLEQIRKISENVIKKLRLMPIVTATNLSLGEPQTELHIIVDRQKASSLGISSSQISSLFRIATLGDQVSKIRMENKNMDIRLRLNDKSRNDLNKLKSLSIMSDKGESIPIEVFSKIEYGSGPNNIERYDRQRLVTVNANIISNASLNEIIDPVKIELEKMNIPKNIKWSFEGDAEMMNEAFNALLVALAMSVLFIYIILASQFESFVHPFTIMTALPLSFIGAFLGLFVANKEISIMSLIGIVMLMGLVTKNSILLVDYTIKLQKQGMKKYDALIKAGIVRLRPILMTTIAMVLGMLPVALEITKGSESRSPMAVAVIGGVITSTFLSLVAVPVFYYIIDDITAFVKNFFFKNILAIDDSNKSELKNE